MWGLRGRYFLTVSLLINGQFIPKMPLGLAEPLVLILLVTFLGG